MLEKVPSLDRLFAHQSGLRQYEMTARRLWRAYHAYSDVPVPGAVIRVAMTPIAAGVKGIMTLITKSAWRAVERTPDR